MGRSDSNVSFELGVSFDGKTHMAWLRETVRGANSATFGLGAVSISGSDIVQVYDAKNSMGMDFGISTGLPLIFVNSYQREMIPVFCPNI